MHPDWQRLTLATWARWTVAGKPLHFSTYGDSIAGKEVFQPKHRKTYRTDTALWRDDPEEISESVSELMRVDSRLHGALTAAERRVLVAACVPLGRTCPAAERAAAAGCSVDTMRAVRRKAMALVD